MHKKDTDYNNIYIYYHNFKKPILEANSGSQKNKLLASFKKPLFLASRSSFLKSWKPIWEARFWAKKRLPKLASRKWASWSLRVILRLVDQYIWSSDLFGRGFLVPSLMFAQNREPWIFKTMETIRVSIHKKLGQTFSVSPYKTFRRQFPTLSSLTPPAFSQWCPGWPCSWPETNGNSRKLRKPWKSSRPQ